MATTPLKYSKLLILFLWVLPISLALAQQQDPRPFLAKEHLYGYTQGQYGEKACNPSIPNVKQTLRHLSAHKLLSFHNDQPQIPHVGLKTHPQGVARIPALENENWLVFTKSGHQAQDAGMIMVCFDNLQSQGQAWHKSKHKHPNWAYGKSRVFFSDPTHNQHHPGGLQMLGRTLVVGSDGADGTLVDFYDMSNPYRVEHLNRLKIDGSQGEREIEPGGKGASAHFVSAAKLRDGRYLLFVARHKRDFFEPTRGKGWFYVSDSSVIDKETQWHYLSFVSFRPNGVAYQGANLLTEAKTGTLYLAMMRPGFVDKNYLDLWQLQAHPEPTYPDDKIALELVITQEFQSKGASSTFDAGGGIHVTPDGKMVVYMIDRCQDFFSGDINLEEFGK